MTPKSSEKVSVKTLKALLRLAEENELQLLEFNTVKILRGGPVSRSKRDAVQKAELKQRSSFDDLPETVDEMDARLHARLKEVM